MMDDEQQEVVIVDAKGTEHVFPPGFDPKRAAAIVRNGGSSALPTKPVSAEDFTPASPGILDTAKDVAKGFGKGAIHSGLDLAQMASQSGMIPGLQGTMPDQLIDKGREKTAYRNTSQKVGGALETVAELAAPVRGTLRAIPSTARAGANFERVMAAAKNLPVDMSGPGNVALQISDLGEAGGTTPRAVSKLLRRVTDPARAPVNFEEGRKWASNISRLSADEFNRLPPAVQREMGSLRVATNSAMKSTAERAGVGDVYDSAMKEYGQAAKLNSAVSGIKDGAKKALPYGVGGGAVGGGYYAAKALLDKLLSGQ